MTLSLKTKAFEFLSPFKVALDGPSAAGKGLIGRMLADRLQLKYFQSSLVYRGLARMCLEQQVALTNHQRIIELSRAPTIINYAQNYDLSDEHIASIASKISSLFEVRANLSKHLLKVMKSTPRLIMEGRDIGTLIAPDADLKIFITADVTDRAERRYKQLRATGKECILSEVLKQLKARDARDKTRAFAPLVPAFDALVIDTTNISPQEIIAVIIKFIKTR